MIELGIPNPATARAAPVLMGHGLGVESAAILTRWLTDPDSRDFDMAALDAIAREHPCPVDPVAVSAAAVHTLRRASATGAEESFVAAPGVVREKRRACFTKAWIEATAPDLFSAAA